MAAADPANPQSWNRYAYVANNPLNATDPTGLLTLPCFAGLDCGGEGGGGGDCDPMLGDGCDGWGGIDLGCGMLDPCDNPCPEPGICESPEGGSGPRSPRRIGGVAPTTETLGLPGGLHVHPLSLGDFFGLYPGTSCDFGTCIPLGNEFRPAGSGSLILVDPAFFVDPDTIFAFLNIGKKSCSQGADLALYSCAEGCGLATNGANAIGDVPCALGGSAGKFSGLACFLRNAEQTSGDNDRCLNYCMKSWSQRHGGCTLQ